MADTERIDKVLWAIRVFKTRTEATDACKGGKVKIGGVNAKPSRMLKVGEIVEIRKGAVQYSYRIKQLTDHASARNRSRTMRRTLPRNPKSTNSRLPSRPSSSAVIRVPAARPRKTAALWRKPGTRSTTVTTLETFLMTSPSVSVSPTRICNQCCVNS